jgi:hypothetical protein
MCPDHPDDGLTDSSQVLRSPGALINENDALMASVFGLAEVLG